ncbi:hypothetical protein [Pseudarthrobacter sp. PvP090]|uniref:hypothetical protein n=1 Tax=Pseudarthrobacter sp. PvP090 TaxID=3156393 RepID=UPI003395110B
MNKKTIRLGIAGALAALSLAGLAVPAQADETMWANPTADTCGPVVDSVRFCTAPDGHPYPVLVNGGAVAGPRPGISGALQIGSTLTVVDGDWDPADAKLTHQWLRNDVPVLGATGLTYLLTTADLGKGIRVTTTAAAPSYAKTTQQSIKTAPVTNAGGTVPSVVYAGYVGIYPFNTHPDRPSRLVSAGAKFKGAPVIYDQYQWFCDGKPIPGATADMFDPRGCRSTGLFSVRVTGHAPGFKPATVTSKQRKVSDFDPAPGAVVTGGTGLGDVLTAVDDVPWSSSPGKPHTYQWLRDGVAIPGATALTYKITAEDQGHTLVLESGTWYDTHIYSNAVAVPAAAGVELKQLTNVTKPVVTGDAVTGSEMKVTVGTWSVPAEKLTFTYNWFSSDREKLSSGPTFTPDKPQVGKTLTVLVTASAPGYTTARAKVTAPKPVTARESTRTISGTLTAGSKVTLTPDPWYDRAGSDSDVQWLRDGVLIAGAYGWSYVLTKADAGKKLSVSVNPITSLGMYQTLNASATVAATPLTSATPTTAASDPAAAIAPEAVMDPAAAGAAEARAAGGAGSSGQLASTGAGTLLAAAGLGGGALLLGGILLVIRRGRALR